MFLPRLLIASIAILAINACMADGDLSYYIAFDATDEQVESIEKSIARWQQASGVMIHKAKSDAEALVSIKTGVLPFGYDGMATFNYEKYYDISRNKIVEYLKDSQIVSLPSVLNSGEERILRHYNHELGHIMAGSGSHDEDCHTTMHSISSLCGTSYVDDTVSSKARDRISKGWLSKPLD